MSEVSDNWQEYIRNAAIFFAISLMILITSSARKLLLEIIEHHKNQVDNIYDFVVIISNPRDSSIFLCIENVI